MKKLFGTKRLLALALTGSLLLSPALAAGTEEKFPAVIHIPATPTYRRPTGFTKTPNCAMRPD